MSWLPPYGWWVRRSPRATVVRGWDWILGACTLLHGHLTLPLVMDVLRSGLVGALVWLVASLAVGAGVGWAVTVDEHGLVFCRTWFCVPITRRRFPRGTNLSVEIDLDAAEHSEEVLYLLVGTGDEPRLGSARSVDAIRDVLARAIAHHQR